MKNLFFIVLFTISILAKSQDQSSYQEVMEQTLTKLDSIKNNF